MLHLACYRSLRSKCLGIIGCAVLGNAEGARSTRALRVTTSTLEVVGLAPPTLGVGIRVPQDPSLVHLLLPFRQL